MVPNNSIFDLWSLVHIGSGVILGLAKISRPYTYGLIIGYEFIENFVLRKQLESFFKEEEGDLNIISDVVVGIAGFEITTYLIKK